MREKPASLMWHNESNVVGDEEVSFQPRFADAQTSVEALRLTSLPLVNTHIYPEAPISTPDGKRFIWRRMNPATGEGHYWIADLDTLKVRQITNESGAGVPIVTPDGQWFYYSVGRTIRRMDPQSLEWEYWYTIPDELGPVGTIITISGCGRRVATSANPGPGRYGAVAIDLEARTSSLCFDHPDARNPHVQYSRNHDHLVCVQVNDGIEFDGHGNLLRLIGDQGASLWVASDDGARRWKLKVGSTPLERVQGHQCWLGDQSRIITTTHRRTGVDQPWKQHWIVTVGPEDAQAMVVADGSAENIHFTHMHTTLDGRFWVSDCNRTARIYVGCIATGRFRRFCDSGATFGAPQYTHPHPFFLADGKTIGWNSDVTGIPHIYVARIPAGFLESLN